MSSSLWSPDPQWFTLPWLGLYLGLGISGVLGVAIAESTWGSRQSTWFKCMVWGYITGYVGNIGTLFIIGTLTMKLTYALFPAFPRHITPYDVAYIPGLLLTIAAPIPVLIHEALMWTLKRIHVPAKHQENILLLEMLWGIIIALNAVLGAGMSGAGIILTVAKLFHSTAETLDPGLLKFLGYLAWIVIVTIIFLLSMLGGDDKAEQACSNS